MANVNAPNGFVPYENFTYGGKARILYLPLSASNSAIGVGDPVTIGAGGVDRAAATTALCGMAAEAKSASSGGYIGVWADPLQLFVGQCDDGVTKLATSTYVRANADIIAGTPANGRSIAEIDESSGATTATLPLKVIRLSDEAGNAFGEFNRLVVKINNHQLGSHTGTAGFTS